MRACAPVRWDVFCLLLLFAGTATAGSLSYLVTGNYLNVATFTDQLGDVDPGITIFDLPVSDNYIIASGDAVTINLAGLEYPYIGDLRATLTFEQGIKSTGGDVFNQIGAQSAGDPGDQGQFGDAGPGTGVYSFNSSSSNDTWTAASGLGLSDSLASATYYTTAALSDSNDQLSSMFTGLSVKGTWVLTIYDYYPPFNTDPTVTDPPPFPWDPQLTGWSLDIAITPEPSTFIPMALAAGLLLWWTRRRAVNSR